MSAPPLVLVVDDEVRSQEAIARALAEDARVLTVSSAEEARGVLERETVDVILCDQRMPGMTGVEFLKLAREHWPDAMRIVISGYTDADDIIAGVNEAGIHQYVVKPWHPETLALTVRSAAELARLHRENRLLDLEMRAAAPVVKGRLDAKRAAVRKHFTFDRISRAPSSPVHELVAVAQRIAAFDIPILVMGESGTGKELIARAIHYASPRSGGAFVVENCAALPDQLLESELFGAKRGAYTGAYEDRIGLLAQADGGTIFLDEIGETSPAFQVKLLRALQEGEIRPVGASRSVTVNVRVIAATNRDLEADVRAGRFREDLYYRLSGMTLRVPALRERPMDVPLIADYLLDEATGALGKRVQGFAPAAMAALEAYAWPGNVRELANEIYRMVALADGPLLSADTLSPRVRGSGPVPLARTPGTGSLREQVEAVEARVLADALERHRGNRTRVAAELGLSRVGLRAKLARYGLESAGSSRRGARKSALFAVK
ncbi:MAG: sigma-54 dependent transcriptional regulator [Burkholderiales bacterium]|nr:sigma-54 dependent transcriptional regulator [Burkholderiales bacterium]